GVNVERPFKTLYAIPIRDSLRVLEFCGKRDFEIRVFRIRYHDIRRVKQHRAAAVIYIAAIRPGMTGVDDDRLRLDRPDVTSDAATSIVVRNCTAEIPAISFSNRAAAVVVAFW